MISIMEAVVTYLKANTGVAALVGARVYHVELPRSEVGNMPQKTVIVRNQGGAIDSGTGPIARPVLSFESTGEKFDQAGQVDEAVFSALKDMRRDVVGANPNERLLHSALPGSPSPGRASVTGWPVVTREATVIADSGV